MFGNLTDFKRKRKAKEAVGFYIAYFVVLLILIIGLGFLLGLVTGNNGEIAFKFGNALAIIDSLVLSFLILIKKKQTGNFLYLLLAAASGVLGAFGGLLLGLIPVAYLTTRSSHNVAVS